MEMSRKSGPLHSLDSRSIFPRVQSHVISSPLDKMFNTVFITSVYYFTHLELGLGWYSDLDKLIIVKLLFDWTSHKCESS